MRLIFYFLLSVLVLPLALSGCAGPKESKTPDIDATMPPIRAESDYLAATLIRIAEQGSEETLIEDPGWLEYIIEIENISTNDFTVQNVKLLNQNGRYVDSASTYEEITAPPNVGVELAGDIAGTMAGIAAEQVIPFGGTVISLLSNAASTMSAQEKENLSRIFNMRVLKNVEIAPTGGLKGSAYLPNIALPGTLVVYYTQNGSTQRIEISLPIEQP